MLDSPVLFSIRPAAILWPCEVHFFLLLLPECLILVDPPVAHSWPGFTKATRERLARRPRGARSGFGQHQRPNHRRPQAGRRGSRQRTEIRRASGTERV